MRLRDTLSNILLTIFVAAAGSGSAMAQVDMNFNQVRCEVDFSKKLRLWDGFGVNYVEVAQSVDYQKDPQEYGGFSLLSESERQEILDMIFGDDGLKPGIAKMFLDPWHQEDPDGPFDHETTTEWMRYFVEGGLERTRKRGDDLTILTTLYGPPPWATLQKFLRGRDLDPAMKYDLAEYMTDWVKFLREVEEFPVKYISLHNEGEDWSRWPADGESGNIGSGHDYNLYWSPEQVVDFIKFMRPMLDEQGLTNVGLTPGETTNWYRFSWWGYSDALVSDPGALANLGLVTSHGFYNGSYGRWFGEHRSVGQDQIREYRPDMHVWVTSTSWSGMNADNLKEHHGNIYSAKVNAITPWACIQRPEQWVGGDPNPGAAFHVDEDGNYTVLRGYYYYKLLSRAGQPGMAVAKTMAMDSQIAIVAFARNGTDNPSAFTVANIKDYNTSVSIEVKGGESKVYHAYRTTDNGEQYRDLGTFTLDDSNRLTYEVPARSGTTFFAQ